MRKPAGHDQFLLTFAPEQWDAVVKFGKFKYKPLEGNRLFSRGIRTTADHLEKFRVLAGIANQLIPGFEVDNAELNNNGHTEAIYSKQFAAVAECCINELYASLDGIRDVIYAVYSSLQGVQKKSTSKLFSKAKNDEYPMEFPQKLNVLLIEAYDDWFLQLRKYRTEFTHGSLGSCHKDSDSEKITYMHSGLGGTHSHIIEDFTGYINEVYQKSLELQHHIFEFFYQSLDLEKIQVLCGLYNGRGYMREIEPISPLTRQSGLCMSTQYPDSVQCPIREKCDAYTRACAKSET